MISLNDDMLRQLQMVELELLIEVDRICKKCGISYNIIAGTMLGAYRHKGFIPWDDDADVAMFRSEYERFREACRSELDETRFYFQDHTCTPGYRWGYGKLRRKNTLFLREHQEHMPYEQGVFIDIFPLDAIPQSQIGRSIMNFRCFCIRKLLWSKVGKVADRSSFKRCVFTLMDCVPEKTVLARLDKMIEKARSKETDWVRILTFPTPNTKWGYRRRWYEGNRKIVFEGYTFPGVTDPDDYLSFKFGEYMKLPPEGERKAHPVSDIRLLIPKFMKDNNNDR